MKLIYIIMAVIFTASPVFSIERESFYSDAICQAEYNGYTTGLPSGLRPDCQTEFAVMEFDWATRSKLYECIGQSLVYANETGKIPVCVLLVRNNDELEFTKQQDLTPYNIVLKVFDVRAWD